MPFDAATIGLVEDALSECLKYHRGLDAFLQRCGVTAEVLKSARLEAERRTAEGARFSKAPKRFVVQEVLNALSLEPAKGDQILASIITSLLAGSFTDASPRGLEAVTQLRARVDTDRLDRERRRKDERDAATRTARAEEIAKEAARQATRHRRDSLKDRFEGLMSESNAQSRGYLLEAFLNDLFEFEGLDPRRSFRLVGEQIDGSFAWRQRTCLVEAKWVSSPVAGADFGAFNYKIEGKTVDTRGLYISINGYSPEAIKGMNAKGALKFVCIDGAHIMRALVSDDGLGPILERVWRHADETGEAYLPVNSL